MAVTQPAVPVERITLGATSIQVSALGIGTWQWGDKLMWNYGGGGYSDEDLRASFDHALQAGVNFFDTAEVYGNGRSETLLGQAARSMPGGEPLVNTMLRVHEVRAEGMTVHGKTLNVSVNGLLVEVDGELNVGRVVDVEFFLPDDRDSVKSRGQVARRAYEASGFHPVFGLRFLELSARDRERIGRYVTSRGNAAGGGK